ncbi:putative NTF2-like protein [Vibrio nigripulchritudo MADA3029]|uniref:Putative NTF2-like protein n=1 Tax=Vibrio nigripulchritudo TaxID=28173 RepID=U4KC46_9VIBR|nr:MULTISPECIES: nuclear transport factor 2 family protein [Vibrio]EGU61669.1 hypothetical protein VINI7043_12616 [Vibrio nigripulchritudo ATCC 27043]KJY74773.1 hypothetical protein TW74_18880 [Vibrio nigripulchritudo]UAB73869.1 nuclear transport factor 2 family protein [Vibrio sp. SCSIO 43132]CCN33688.1 putative NTF2-like protein [Vibrio nigripulchritudo AM115]CCN41893.1 putative NTF2-like protein [Vibrio nigripulchritudo FTn2]
MDESIKNACIAFSCGDVDELIPFLTDKTEWQNVGKDVIVGTDNIRSICYQMEQEDVSLKVSKQLEASEHLVVQGHGEAEQPFFFCDIFQIEDGKISAITSYLIAQSKA